MPTLSRPHLSTAELRQVIPRAVLALVDANNDHEKRLQAREGDLAGVEADVETLDAGLDAAEEDITALEGRFGTDGSIFSMLGPAGATAPVVAYDFTRYDPALTIAQNIAAANQSGVSALDLTATGSAQIKFLTFSGDPQATPYAWMPFAASVQGGALFSGSGTDKVATAGSPAALELLGALTVEWLGYVTVIPGGTSDCYFWFFDGAGETEATNSLYGLHWKDSDESWRYFHESGAGVDSDKSFLIATRTMLAETRTNPLHITLTRSGAGSVRLYFNGRLAAAAGTAAPNALPTGGTSSDLSISIGSDTAVRLATLGFRLFGVELTAAQVQESYRRTFFGTGAA